MLDGALFRLVLPGLAGTVVIVSASAIMWWLVHPAVALLVGLGSLVGPNLVFLTGQRIACRASRRAEAAMQATRTGLVEMVAAREDLAVYGQLGRVAGQLETAIVRQRRRGPGSTRSSAAPASASI